MKPSLRSIPSELPDPPYCSDISVKSFQFRVDHERLFASDTWAIASPDMRPWLLMLWHTAWMQIPAGAFTNDHAVIAAKIGMDVRQFSAHSDILLRGFVLHSDGRLYHPVIVEQVLKVCQWRQDASRRQADYRERKKDAESNALLTRESRMSHGQVTTLELELELELEHELAKNGVLTEPCRASSTSRPPWSEVERVLEDLNAKTGQQFKLKNGVGQFTQNAKNVRSRIAESSVETCLAVIDVKVAEWQGTDLEQYLRPGTLFGKQKFEQYVGQIGREKNKRKYGSFLNPDDDARQPINTTWSTDT